VKRKRCNPARVKHWEVIADNLSKAGWSWGCVLAIDNGRTIWIAHAHRDGKRVLVHADEKLSFDAIGESRLAAHRPRCWPFKHFRTSPERKNM
jgi:hypothetical protein